MCQNQRICSNSLFVGETSIRIQHQEHAGTSGARLPYRIWMCPLSLIGVSSGTITCWSWLSSGQSFRFSARVLPARASHGRLSAVQMLEFQLAS